MRGEYPALVLSCCCRLGSPPLARGIHWRCFLYGIIDRITPACAGNTSQCSKVKFRSWDHPRLRGEYSFLSTLHCTSAGSPPLARGIPECPVTISRPKRDHPRLRGEYSDSACATLSMIGSPPLARGILSPLSGPPALRRITPACAGNTLLFFRILRTCRDHPRLRGEYVLKTPQANNVDRITPACAGNTTQLPLLRARQWDHPRLRGEYTSKSLNYSVFSVCSLHNFI